ITSFFLFLVFLFLLYRGVPVADIRTIMFVGVTLDALFFAFSFKSLRRPLWKINPFNNRYLLFALGFSLALLAAALYVDPLRRLLGIVTPTPFALLILVGIGIFNVIAIELSKWYFIRRTLNHKIEL
ncbi:cation transporting ATPase C-terminal domain-containing protein, partial [Patescibacteria group bacterium]|nr:cation transporting ATPase C-terminal domain-containing protein [Patescibacteria group bacterium]